jgi:hypothetical protein
VHGGSEYPSALHRHDPDVLLSLRSNATKDPIELHAHDIRAEGIGGEPPPGHSGKEAGIPQHSHVDCVGHRPDYR